MCHLENRGLQEIAYYLGDAGLAMDDAPLPIEVCESIIDYCHNIPHRWWDTPAIFKETYDTLRACTLVCSAWFPRSRRNLLRDVRLGSFDHVHLLLRLVTEKPRLAGLVTAIVIVGGKYVPFARFPLPGLLPNCRRLTVTQFPQYWRWNVYPPGYSRSISDFRWLTELELTIDRLSAPELFHIIWSLPLLCSLELVDNFGSHRRITQFGSKFGGKPVAKCKPETCPQLRRLSFRSIFIFTNVCILSLPLEEPGCC